MLSWSDFQIIVAIHEAKTLSAAARKLGVNQSTVSRILKRIEANLKDPIFSHITGTYQLTPGGEVFFRAGKEMEGIISKLKYSHPFPATEGTIRLTTVEALVRYLLTRLGEFRKQYPRIVVELNGANQNVNLSQRQFHAALRLRREEKSKILLTKKIGEIGISGYRSKDKDASLDWIGYESSLATTPEEKWLSSQLKKQKPYLQVSSYVTMETAIEQGLGVGLLPRFIGDQNKSLQRFTGGQIVLSRPVWFVSHPDERCSPAMQIFSKWLFGKLEEDRSILAGI